MAALKTCSKCAQPKPRAAFHRSSRSTDGLQSGCKDCRCAQVREIYARQPERYRTYQSKHRKENREQWNEYFRGYRKRRPDVIDGTRARYEAKYPERAAARAAVASAVRSGVLRKPACCDECRATGRIEAHHDDYAKPLVVRWLCKKKCHPAADALRRSAA